MKHHALRTALTLYQGGTLDLETAARQAGVSPERLQHQLARLGESVPSTSATPDRVPVRAD